MIAASEVRDRLALAYESCQRALQEPPFPQIIARLGDHANPATAFQLLTQVTLGSSPGGLSALCASLELHPEDHAVERALLMLASQHASTQVPALPVSERVKELFAEEFEFFANPGPAWIPQMGSDNVRFREMALLATLRRFPAGQFQWEPDGVPRSWLWKTPTSVKLLRYVLFKMGGFSPTWEFHTNARRKNKGILTEKQACLSFYRGARSMEKQPEVRAFMSTAWFYSESAAQVSPHLAWLRTLPQSGGAQIFELDPAPEDSGFLVGSVERRKAYEEGRYRPRIACVLWARKDFIAWANRHPEYDL
ncbi:MAG: hypothetical protein WAM71_04680 [Candidatus Korobacteraceae bacterium]